MLTVKLQIKMFQKYILEIFQTFGGDSGFDVDHETLGACSAF